MLDLTSMSTPTQSNGKIEFIDLSAVKVRAERKKVEIFDLKYVCEFKQNVQANLERKHNFVLDKKYLSTQTKDAFWTIGVNSGKAYIIQSLDGAYMTGKMIMRVWKGENPSTKIISEAAYTALEQCGLVDNTTQNCTFDLVAIDTNLTNCNVYEILVAKPVAEEAAVVNADVISQDNSAGTEVESSTDEEATVTAEVEEAVEA